MKNFLISNGVEVFLALSFVVLIFFGVKVRRKVLKQVFFNASAVLISIFLYEVYLSYWPFNRIEVLNDKKELFYVGNPHLGYAPIDTGKVIVNERKFYNNPFREIYDVKYTIENGYRTTPDTDTSNTKNVVFLGGSFIFGHGLNDEETLPYFYGQENRDCRVFNLAFGGYGTHQAYAIVKSEFEKKLGLKNDQETKVFYLFIPPHILRANGYAEWDRSGPYYYLKNGGLDFGGNFKDKFNKNNIIQKEIIRMTQSSDIYKRHLRSFIGLGEDEIELCLRLIQEMDRMLKKKGIKFTVLLEYGSIHADFIAKIKPFLVSHEIQFTDIFSLMPEKKSLKDQFYIKGDNHPTKKFNQTLAKHL